MVRDTSVPVPAASPDPAPPPEPAAAAPVDFAALTEAEQYALLHPARARRIRAEGGLPARLDYGPPEPDVVHDLVHGTSPILRALDRPPTELLRDGFVNRGDHGPQFWTCRCARDHRASVRRQDRLVPWTRSCTTSGLAAWAGAPRLRPART